MHKLGFIAVLGMLMAVIGIAIGDNGNRLLAGGFALCIGVLIHWVNALQKEVNILKTKDKTEDMAD